MVMCMCIILFAFIKIMHKPHEILRKTVFCIYAAVFPVMCRGSLLLQHGTFSVRLERAIRYGGELQVYVISSCGQLTRGGPQVLGVRQGAENSPQ